MSLFLSFFIRFWLRLLPLSALCLGGLLFFGPAASPCAAATNYFVSPTGSDANPGTLAVPFLTIQHGINTAVNGDTVTVEDGTYTGPGNVDLDFGGRNITVTSVNGPTKTIIDCGGIATTDGSGNHRGFYLHSGETNAAVSGFTVENGYEIIASSIPDSGYGGGIYTYNNGGTITLANCIITNNTVNNGGYSLADGGGGVFNHINKGGTTTLANCIITNNRASYRGGIANFNRGGTITLTDCTATNNRAIYDGGGIYSNNYGGTTTLTNCTITNNAAGSRGGVENFNYNGGTITLTNCAVTNNIAASLEGGGVLNSNHGGSSTITLTNCTITNNAAGSDGGGVYNYNNYDVDRNGAITLTNCGITSNTAPYDNGGGVYNYNTGGSSGTIALTNCTLTHNTANSNGGGAFNKIDSGSSGIITLTNCIVYADTNGEVYNDTSTISNALVNYSDIQGGYSGVGNINADPLFVNSPTDLHLQSGSPCLGTGTASGAPTDLSPINCTICMVSIDPKGRILVCRRTSLPMSRSLPFCSKPKRANKPLLRSANSTTSRKIASIAGATALAA